MGRYLLSPPPVLGPESSLSTITSRSIYVVADGKILLLFFLWLNHILFYICTHLYPFID